MTVIRSPSADPAFRAWMVRRMTYHLRREIYRARWRKPPTKFWETWRVEWRSGQGLSVSSTHPAALILDRGMKRQPMTWLMRQRPDMPGSGPNAGLPPRTRLGMARPKAVGGGVDFRTPPVQGRRPWTHPGLPPKRYLSRAMAAFSKELREAASAHIREQMSRALRKSGPGAKRGRKR